MEALGKNGFRIPSRNTGSSRMCGPAWALVIRIGNRRNNADAASLLTLADIPEHDMLGTLITPSRVARHAAGSKY